MLFFAPSRIRPLYCGAASSISFCSATPVLLAAFVFSSRLFHVLSGLQGDSFTQLAEHGVFNVQKDEGCTLCSLLQPWVFPPAALGAISASVVTQRSFLHMGTRDARRTGLKLLPASAQLARLRKSPRDPSQVFQGECDKPRQGD